MSLTESEIYDAGIFLAMLKHGNLAQNVYYLEAIETSMRALAAIERVRRLCEHLERSPYRTARPATIRQALDGPS